MEEIPPPKETDFILWPIKWADDIHIERCVAHLIMFSFKCTHCKIACRLTNTEEDGVKKNKSPTVHFLSNYLCFVPFSTQVIMKRWTKKKKIKIKMRKLGKLHFIFYCKFWGYNTGKIKGYGELHVWFLLIQHACSTTNRSCWKITDMMP